MTILIVEDEAKMREFIKLYLIKEGYDVLEAPDGQQALERFNDNKIDLVILDIMMPKLDGFAVSRAIRKYSKVPIVMLTAVEGEVDQVKGYEYGADDYVVKPFKIKILLAKINRIIKSRLEQSIENNLTHDTFVYESLTVDIAGKRAMINELDLKLTPKLIELLIYLIAHKGIALSREQILEHVWGYDFEGGTRVVDNHIKKLRQKLDKYSSCVETVVSVGYKFILR